MTGLRARGGFEVDLAWEQKHLSRVVIKSLNGNRCRVRAEGKFVTWSAQGDVLKQTELGGIIEFETVSEGVYTLTVMGANA